MPSVHSAGLRRHSETDQLPVKLNVSRHVIVQEPTNLEKKPARLYNPYFFFTKNVFKMYKWDS